MGDYAGMINQYGGAAAQGVGTLTNVYSQYQGGKDQQAISRANAELARSDAADVLRRGGEEQQRLARSKRQLIGSQQAAIGANNVAMSGSALDMLADTETMFARDAATVRNDAARQAWGLKVEADMQSYSGEVARKNQTTQAFSTLATGGLESYASYKKAKEQ